jgi:hypothetical protein
VPLVMDARSACRVANRRKQDKLLSAGLTVHTGNAIV